MIASDPEPGLQLGKFRVGDNHPPLVVAEIGINHGGSLDRAKRLVKLAVLNGATVIKHQTHTVWDEMSHEAKTKIPGNSPLSIYEIINQSKLDFSEERDLADFTREMGAEYISTPFSRSAVDFLVDLKVPFLKIGSGECNNLPFLEYVASTGLPIILSTGMQTISDVYESVDVITRHHRNLALLHCTNLYPTSPSLVRLGGIAELKEAFPDLVVGFSDHTEGIAIPLAAVALGSAIIEKHFTDSHETEGPDISASMDPRELGDLVKNARRIWDARGGVKGQLPEEDVTATFAKSSVVATEDIQKGDILTAENIWVMRPAGGAYGPKQFQALIGRTANLAVPKHYQIPEGIVDGLESI